MDLHEHVKETLKDQLSVLHETVRSYMEEKASYRELLDVLDEIERVDHHIDRIENLGGLSQTSIQLLPRVSKKGLNTRRRASP